MSLDESLDRRCDRLESVWNAGDEPALEDFLHGVAEEHRSMLLQQLIAIDIEMRQRRGKSVSMEDYRRLGDEAAEFATNRLAMKAIAVSPSRQPANTQCTACGVTVMSRRDHNCPSCGELMQEALATYELASTPVKLANSVPGNASDPDFAATIIVSRRTAEGSLEFALTPDGGAEFLPGTLLNDRYRLVAELGRGGMGTVFLATDESSGRRVALKIPRRDASGELAARFRREARVLSQLSHPNLVRIIAVESHQGCDYVVMEYVAGGPLEPPKNLAPHERLPASLQIMELIADAIDYAHRQGVVHRDLKPQNIIIDLSGQPVVVDFGLARQLNSQDTRLTADDQILGTPAYMAPEQFDQTAGVVGPQADIFSLGVVLFQLITGEHPIANHMIGRISDAPKNSGPLSHSLPLNIAAICQKAMAWRPADRYDTAQQLKQEIAAARKQLPQMPLDNFGDFTTTDYSMILRVCRTQYGYRVPMGASSISVGRQRRKSPEDLANGNDFVIRVPASDSGTLRISRHHFRIDRIGREFRIVDLSRNGTMLNGRMLEKGIPTTIHAGDELTISGVLVLQVIITDDAAVAVPCGAVSVLAHGISPFSLELERSIGDLVTFEQ